MLDFLVSVWIVPVWIRIFGLLFGRVGVSAAGWPTSMDACTTPGSRGGGSLQCQRARKRANQTPRRGKARQQTSLVRVIWQPRREVGVRHEAWSSMSSSASLAAGRRLKTDSCGGGRAGGRTDGRQAAGRRWQATGGRSQVESSRRSRWQQQTNDEREEG